MLCCVQVKNKPFKAHRVYLQAMKLRSCTSVPHGSNLQLSTNYPHMQRACSDASNNTRAPKHPMPTVAKTVYPP